MASNLCILKKIRHAYTQKAKILYTVNKWGEQSIKIECHISLKSTYVLNVG